VTGNEEGFNKAFLKLFSRIDVPQLYFNTIRFQRITRRQEGGSAGVFNDTLRKPTTKPTKLAKESGLV
jgi:hypothetical protein